MSQLVVPNEPTRVVIGVCGEQASGKTVFLTCVFQSIWTAVSDDLIIDFDRKEVGNAIYFQSVEEELIRRGPAPGTRLLFPARIYLKPYATAPGVPRPVLSVDILDFAGGHFRSIADLKHRLDDSDADPEEAKALREVNETLEQANAFIILINSREIDPADETPKSNPFTPSVNFILAHCRAERKPVALLFSQVDQTPALTDNVLHEIPRVRQFEQQFTGDLTEALSGGRPYGVVRRISCYETTDDGITPRKQGEGGNIWKSEPAEIVLDLIRAALPEILERLRLAAEKVARERADAEHAELRKKQRQWVTAAAVLLAIIGVIAMLAVVRYRRDVTRQVRLLEMASEGLRSGDLASVVPLASDVAQILTAHRDRPEETRKAVRGAIADLQAAAGAAAQRLLAEPSLHPDYRENINRFETVAAVVGPETSEDLQRSLLPVLTARRDFLAGWSAAPQMSRRQRARELNKAARRFEQRGDRRFSELLTQEATRTKKAEVSSWQALVDADPDVATRLATIQNLAAAALQETDPAEPDPEFTHLARIALLEHVTTTILKRSENALMREKLVAPLLPDLARFSDGEVRFDVLARDLLNCSRHDDCAARRMIVQTAESDAATSLERWRSPVENLLRSLVLDLPPQQRREIWNAVAASLVTSYFFSSRNDAWPDGVAPLHTRVAAVANGDADGTMQLIERLSQRPMYSEELEYLSDKLAATEIRRRVVPIYSSILGALAAPNDLLPFDDLTRASEEVSSSFSGGTATRLVASLTGEIHQILVLVQSVNDLRLRGNHGDAITPGRLERLLRDAKREHCGALLSHQPPTECSDAA